MTGLEIAVLLGVGLVGGVWNAIAGGATLFTFPALMFVGLPPLVANATNYLGLLPSNAAALLAYGPQLRRLSAQLIPLVLISGFGATLGAVLLLFSDPAAFMVLVPFLILTATLLFALGEPLRRLLSRLAGQSNATLVAFSFLFLSSIYGGYFGAGLGIILLAIAQVMGHSDFHDANCIKNLLATSFTLISIAIFGIGGLIDWSAAGLMVLGSSLGGYAGGRWAKNLNQNLLRTAVIGFGLILSVTHFWRVFSA